MRGLLATLLSTYLLHSTDIARGQLCSGEGHPRYVRAHHTGNRMLRV